jgi:hypothetical protein
VDQGVMGDFYRCTIGPNRVPKPLIGTLSLAPGALRQLSPGLRFDAGCRETLSSLCSLLPISHTSLPATTFQWVIEGMGSWVKGHL